MKVPRKAPPALAVLLPFLGLIVLALLLAPERAAARQEGSYAGIDQCAACHEQTVTAFKESIHGKKGFEMRSVNACETCHGPGKAHVDAGGGKGSMKNPATMPKAEQSAICLTCHDRGDKFLWEGSTHDSRGLACESCHSIHKPQAEKAQLKAASPSDLCFTCHKQKESQFYRASHHPLREGKMECTSCHNPHASNHGKLLDAEGSKVCLDCHGGIVPASAKSVHKPVAETRSK